MSLDAYHALSIMLTSLRVAGIETYFIANTDWNRSVEDAKARNEVV